MKRMLIDVSEPVYSNFLLHAKRTNRTAAELIVEAMERYRQDHIDFPMSPHDRTPLHLGKVVKPLSREDDLLGEMLNER